VQIGIGVNTSATNSDFSSGASSATGIASNMALTGAGFFVVQSPSGMISYERAGDFTANSLGQLVDPSGNLAMGYPSVNGVINTASALQPLNVGSGLAVPAVASTSFSIPTNLNANAAVGATSGWTSNISLYDSLGNAVPVDMTFTKTAANTWSYDATIPSSSVTAGATGTTSVGSGSLTFDTSGNLAAGTANPILSLPTLADGSAPMSAVTWDLNNSSGSSTLTQNDLASSVTSSGIQNGNGAGTLASYVISSNGTIEGTYSSGATQALGQVALANFANNEGLTQSGSNLYQQTAGSGQAQIGVAGTGGLGTITGGSIEESNVDTAAEFGKMIIAQQAYQANAKTVTTMDQISQATIAMISS
jgi:flagellar hook protein FlgE